MVKLKQKQTQTKYKLFAKHIFRILHQFKQSDRFIKRYRRRNIARVIHSIYDVKQSITSNMARLMVTQTIVNQNTIQVCQRQKRVSLPRIEPILSHYSLHTSDRLCPIQTRCMATVIQQQSQTKQTYTKQITNSKTNFHKQNPTCYIVYQSLNEIDINWLEANGYQSHANFAHFSHTLLGRCTSSRCSTKCTITFGCTNYRWQCTIQLKFENHLPHIPPKQHTKPRGKQNPTRKRYKRAISNKTSLILITQTTTFVNTFQISGNKN